jgi:glutaredoxin
MAEGSNRGKKPLAQAVRVLLLVSLVLGFACIAAVTGKPGMKWASGASEKQNVSRPDEPAPQQESVRGVSAILFVNELSCPCTREQCRVAEAIVQTLKEDFSNRVRFETIDYELQHEKAKPLMEKYDAIMVPVLVILDQGGNVVWRCEDFSDESAIRSRLEELIRKVEPETEAAHNNEN